MSQNLYAESSVIVNRLPDFLRYKLKCKFTINLC